MFEEDEEKMTFITDEGTFCYTRMPFGVRNVGETSKKLMDKIFHNQVAHNVEAYVERSNVISSQM